MDQRYQEIVQDTLSNGQRKENRTGVDTISSFFTSYVTPVTPFPILTTKQVSWKNVLVETLWYLSGEKRLDILHAHGCKFWDHWMTDTGEIPSPYGHFWRSFPGRSGDVDQVSHVIDTLKRDRNSRRAVVCAWDPDSTRESKLPPCHMLWVANVSPDGRLNVHLSQRSLDVALGLPYNTASYALLVHLLARFTGYLPGKLAHSAVDVHIYTAKPDGSMSDYDHVPGLLVQTSREPYPQPALVIDQDIKNLGDALSAVRTCSTKELLGLFKLQEYVSHPSVFFKPAV